MKYFLILMVFVSTCALGQDDLKFGNTATTNKTPTYKPKHKELKKKRPIQWVKKSTDGLLTGNKCMQDVTADMGFEYLVQVKGQPGSKSEVSRLMHNFTAKFGILLRNGPFWKFKLKKQRKLCREKTGDFVG